MPGTYISEGILECWERFNIDVLPIFSSVLFNYYKTTQAQSLDIKLSFFKFPLML